MRDDSSQLWKFINEVCGRRLDSVSLPSTLAASENRTLDDPVEIADGLNRHFAKLGNTTVAHLEKSRNIETLLDKVWRRDDSVSLFLKSLVFFVVLKQAGVEVS